MFREPLCPSSGAHEKKIKVHFLPTMITRQKNTTKKSQLVPQIPKLILTLLHTSLQSQAA